MIRAFASSRWSLGIAGFILGPMLGVFLLGMFTRGRGSDRGNLLAITIGLVITIVLGGLHVYAANLIAPILGTRSATVRHAEVASDGFVHVVSA